MKTVRLYKSEADLCRDFIAWAQPQGWTAYAETGGWDVLLVADDGRQFGVQAKLHFNATLLRQALPIGCDTEGPDCRGILLPTISRDIREVCEVLGLGYFEASPFGLHKFSPRIDVHDDDWNPERRCELPDYMPDVIAGAAAPVVLTKWKVSALRVCAMLEIRGSITAKEIRQCGIDPRRWINPATRWLRPIHLKHGVYERGERLRFPAQHPRVYAEILEQIRSTNPSLTSGKGA